VSRLLVTGAFGNLGEMVIDEARRQGLIVLASDLDTPRNRRAARRLGLEHATSWGDIRGIDADAVLGELAGVIHLAAVLPPVTETAAELSHSINVGATTRLIETMERSSSRAVLVYPSSVTVYGLPAHPPRLHRTDEPTITTDNYSAHKIEVEQRLVSSSLDWVVLRVGVAVDARRLRADTATIRTLFGVAPDNPLEYVHPRDVALAMVNAIRRPKAYRRILNVGGGESCRVTQHEFLSTAMDALGIGLPREMLGNARYYTAWMDTAESQAILEYQRHTFADYRAEMSRKLLWLRWGLTPFRPAARWGLRRFFVH